MTIQIANALFRYFEGLYYLNQNLIGLSGCNIHHNWEQIEDTIDKIVLYVPRLIPYRYNKLEKQYVICSNDGLMEFTDSISFLADNYNEILQRHYPFLVKAIKIRNKLEHQMHGAIIQSGCSNYKSPVEVSYKVMGEVVEISSSEIILFLKDLNTMFSRIQNLVLEFASKEEKNDYPYYQRLVRIDFCNFNKIYESDLLPIFGATLLPF